MIARNVVEKLECKMTNKFDGNIASLQKELYDFVQDKIDEGISSRALSYILVAHGTKIGLDLGVDPRIVAVNLFSSISERFSESFDKDYHDEDYENVYEDTGDSNIVHLNGFKNLN